MSYYNFLANLTLTDPGRTRAPKDKNPTGLAVRIFSNGEVYPSKDLVEKFSLEYPNKDNQIGYFGFDVVDSTEWAPTATLPRMIMFGLTAKTEAKVDLFASCRWNEDGTPKSSVLTQGAVSETLLTLVRSMGYLNENQKYCDLVLVTDYPVKTEDGLAYIPKMIERGKSKGEQTYERREDITFYPVNTPENLEAMKTDQAEATTTTTAGVGSPAETL